MKSGIPQKRFNSNQKTQPTIPPNSIRTDENDQVRKYAAITASSIQLTETLNGIIDNLQSELDNVSLYKDQSSILVDSIIRNIDLLLQFPDKFQDLENSKHNEIDKKIHQIQEKIQKLPQIILNLIQTNKKLQAQIDSNNVANQETTEMQQKIKSLSADIIQKDAKISQLENSLKLKTIECDQITNGACELKQKYDLLMKAQTPASELEDLRNRIAELENENAQLLKEKENTVATLNSGMTAVQNRVDQLNESYQKEVSENQKKNELIDELKNKISDLQQNTSASNEAQALTEENKILKNKVDAFSKMIEILQNPSNVSPEIKEQQETIHNLQNKIEELKRTININDLEIEELKSILNKSTSEKDEIIKDLKNQIHQKEFEIDSKNAEIDCKEETINSLNEQLKKDNSLQGFVESLSQINEHNEEKQQFEKEIKEKDSQITNLSKLISEKDTQINFYKLQITEKDEIINQKSNALTQKESTTLSLENQFQENQKNVHELNNRNNELNEKIKELNDNLELVSQEIEKKNNYISSISEQLDEKNKSIDNLEDRLDEILKKYNETIDENSKLHSQVELMNDQINSFKLQIEEVSANDKTSALAAEVEELQGKISTLDLQNEESSALIKRKDDQIEELKSRQNQFIEQLKESDKLALDLDNLKVELNSQKKLLEQVEKDKSQILDDFQYLKSENAKLTSEKDYLEEEKIKLTNLLSECEDKINHDLEEECSQLILHIKELESKVSELQQQLSELSIVKGQNNVFEEELKSAKLMIETYKQLNDILQNKLDQADFQNKEIAKFNITPVSPVQRCTISCSPVKLLDQTDINIDSEALIKENLLLKKDIEKWKQATHVLKNTVESAKEERDFYQSECGKLNSSIITLQYDLNKLQKEISTITKEREELKEKFSSIQELYQKEIKSQKESIVESENLVQKISFSQRAYDELKIQYNQFVQQLSKLLQKDTEQEIIFSVIHLLDSSRSMPIINSNLAAQKLQSFAIAHLSNMDSFLQKLNSRAKTIESSFSKIDKKLRLTSQKMNDIKKNHHKGGNTLFYTTEKKRPLGLLKNNILPSPQSIPIKKQRHAPREYPSNIGNITPKVNQPIYI